MKDSTSTERVGSPVGVGALALLDVAGRLAIPLSVFALARGLGDLAIVAALSVSALAVARGFCSGWIIEQNVRRQWGRIVSATTRHSIVTLRNRSKEEAVILLLDAAYRVAVIGAEVVPRLAADLVGLVLVSIGVAWFLSPAWLLLGSLVVLVGGMVLRGGRRRIRDAEQRSFDLFGEVGQDLRALLAAPAELRAHRRQAHFAGQMLERVRAMARDQRRVNTYSSMIGLLPFGVALVAAVLPLRANLEALTEAGHTQQIAEVAVLGGAALVFAVGCIRGAEALVRATPHRKLLAQYLALTPADGGRPAPVDAESSSGQSSWHGDVEMDGVTVVYPGAQMATPCRFSHRWPQGVGLAIVGDNGSGKSTLALTLLGLIEPTEGVIRIGGKPSTEHGLAGSRRRAVYLPQNAYVDTARSVEWHLRLLAGDEPGEEQLLEALRTVELEEPLTHHGADDELPPLEVPAGQLSGGELRRLHLARVFLEGREGAAELIVLDEPEAGLDEAGRSLLRERLQQLVRQARVILIAHDKRVIPDSFQVVRCERGALEPR